MNPSAASVRVCHIQHFSVNDGDGIRTTIFLGGCPLRCAWCCNPETWAADASSAGRSEEARKLLGRRMSVQEILGEIRRYAIFHRYSGGGITWSGGEPFHFPRSIRSLVEACADLGASQAAETSGHFTWAACSPTLRLLDLLFVDIKHMDGEIHRRFTGKDNAEILDNIRRIGNLGIETVVRIPLVRGVNDGRQNLVQTAAFVRNHIPGKRIEVLPYHDLGKDKYRILGLETRHTAFEAVGRDDASRAEEILAGEGVEIVRYR